MDIPTNPKTIHRLIRAGFTLKCRHGAYVYVRLEDRQWVTYQIEEAIAEVSKRPPWRPKTFAEFEAEG